MKSLASILLVVLLVVVVPSIVCGQWLKKEYSHYSLYYDQSDQAYVGTYQAMVDKGIESVVQFFNKPFKTKFNVVIYPHRSSLDSAWQKDWGMPDFKSECWMVASGVADKIDIISPRLWDIEACEHKYADTLQTQRLITHELVHVYHGQVNASPDFSDVTNIDWLVEGVATYASGQCDEKRIGEVKKAIADKSVPQTLDKFWTGKMKYGLSGSMVMYIDNKYGRPLLVRLLPLNKDVQVFSELGTTEQELVAGWMNYMNDR